MTALAVGLLLVLALLAADIWFFLLTPFEERPMAWWRYAPLSGFIMYAVYRNRRSSRG